jgi:hypothetical protein
MTGTLVAARQAPVRPYQIQRVRKRLDHVPRTGTSMPPWTGSFSGADRIGAGKPQACPRTHPRDCDELSLLVLARRLGRMRLHSARHEHVLTGRGDRPPMRVAATARYDNLRLSSRSALPAKILRRSGSAISRRLITSIVGAIGPSGVSVANTTCSAPKNSSPQRTA